MCEGRDEATTKKHYIMDEQSIVKMTARYVGKSQRKYPCSQTVFELIGL